MYMGFWRQFSRAIDIKKSSATVTNFEIKVGKMMKYEKSFYCILFREMNDEHTAKYLCVLVQESWLMLIS